MKHTVAPCPFCGSHPTVDSEYGWSWWDEIVWTAIIACPNPDCGFRFERSHEGEDLYTEEDGDDERCVELERRTVELWNRRAGHTDDINPDTGLKPCPFCGHHAFSFGDDMGPCAPDGHDWRGVAACSNAGNGFEFETCGEGFELWETSAEGVDLSETLRCLAVKRWNRRMQQVETIKEDNHEL